MMTSAAGIRRCLVFAVLVALAAPTLAVPTKDYNDQMEPQPIDILRSCRKTHHHEDFRISENYTNAPTSGPFRYTRFGLYYYNLARVDLDKHFDKHMVGKKPNERDSGCAAVCGKSGPKGHCFQDAVSVLALHPTSPVHAFQVNHLSFFCLKGGQPARCNMEFIFSEQGSNMTHWRPVLEYSDEFPVEFRPIDGYAPKAEVGFHTMPLLQALAFRPAPPSTSSNDSSGETTQETEGKLKGHHNVTAYVDNIDMTVWECESPLPKHPLHNYMRSILAGENPFEFFGRLPPM